MLEVIVINYDVEQIIKLWAFEQTIIKILE